MTRNLTTAVAVILIGATTIIGAQAADMKPLTLAAPIEQCIRDNAPKVEAAVPDLNQAVEFLIGNVCAQSVAVEQVRQRQLADDRRAAEWDKMCETQKATKRDGKTGADVDQSMAAMCSEKSVFKVGFITEPRDVDGDELTIYRNVSYPAAAVSLAARLLLDLRLSHTKSRPHQ